MMTRKEVMEWLSGSKDETERYTPLVQMICVFEDDTETTEVIFAVPINWLVALKNEESKDYLWSEGDVRGWLQEKYTSEDSQAILEKAVLENKVAFYFIDEKPILPF